MATTTTIDVAGGKVLIGYDGSECAAVAIRDLTRAGLGEGGEAHVVSVADVAAETNYPVVALPGGQGAELWPVSEETVRAIRDQKIARAERLAQEGAGIVTAALPGWRVRSDVAVDSPVAGLVRKAQDWPADLIVVGSHGRSALGRFMLGSVSQHVLHHAPCSVRISRPRRETARAPAGDDRRKTRSTGLRLIVGVDGSSDAAAAVEQVARRRWPAGTEVRVVTAVDARLATSVVGFAAWLGAAEPRGSGIRDALDAVANNLHGAGLAATAAISEGDPKHVLVEEADRWGADCIFLGARGHTRLERMVLGSVSSAVAARAHCSVEVVRTR